MKAITAETLYLILPFKVAQLTMLMQKKLGISLIEAMNAIYHSNTYKELCNEETKLWHLGPIALFEHYQEFK